MSLAIGTRGSALALAQAAWVRERLGEAAEVRVIRTVGDDSEAPLAGLGDGVFVGAIERALLAGEIDVAVHSLKDLPTAPTPGLLVAAVPAREDPRDVLVTRVRGGAPSLPARPVVGTSSVRRAAFVRALAGDAVVRDIRGNVETRLAKVTRGEYDATILALAGLRRLGIAVAPAEILSLDDCPPAPGQGALAVQCRAADGALAARLARLEDAATRRAVDAERALLRLLGASCEIPLGAWGAVDGDDVVLRASLARPGAIVLRASARGRDPESVAAEVAAALVTPVA